MWSDFLMVMWFQSDESSRTRYGVYNNVNAVNTTELYTLKWLTNGKCYVYFIT